MTVVRDPIHVLLVFGGRSEEHEVSVVSARSVLEAMNPSTYEITCVGIDKGGRWHLLPTVPRLASGETDRLPEVGPGSGTEVALAREPGARELVAESGERRRIDVAFPLMHGPFGEDGTIQGLFELASIPYVGAGVLASALGMDKAVQKVLFRDAGLPVAAHEVVHAREWRDDPEDVAARAEALGMPVFVKPSNLGSSVGISKVKSLSDLDAAVEEALRHGPKALIEASAEGAREIEVAVLGNDDPVASVPGEIVPSAEFYDYRAKYLDERTKLEVPADVSAEVAEELQRMAVAAFRAIDAAGMARVDFFVGEDGEILVNEINTIPGFTRVSMYPRLWEASGVPYPELVDRLIRFALDRHTPGEPSGEPGPGS